MKQIIVKNPNNLPCIEHNKLTVLQGDLKTLSDEDRVKLTHSIEKHGYFVPAFVWKSEGKHYILDATQRYHVLNRMKEEGYDIPPIPYVEIEAENKKDAAEKLLQITSRYGEINPNTSFLTDFDLKIDDIEIAIPELELEGTEEKKEIEEDEVPETPNEPLTKSGELWLCGKHRVLCGDCTKAEDVEKLMEGKKADMLFTDPPYGLSVVTNGKVGGGGPTKFGKIGGKNWVASKTYPVVQGDETTEAAEKAIKNLSEIEKKIIFGGNYFTDFLPPSRCWIVWDKDNTGNFADAELAWTSFDKGVKLYKWLWNGLSRKGSHAIEGKTRFHPTQKPVGLFGKILQDFTEENDIIIDPFLGSGTALIATHQLKRICYGMEIEPRYIDVILDRYATLTGEDPMREDGMLWSEIKLQR